MIPSIAEQHAALVHCDGSECSDGCSSAPCIGGEAALMRLFAGEDPAFFECSECGLMHAETLLMCSSAVTVEQLNEWFGEWGWVQIEENSKTGDRP